MVRIAGAGFTSEPSGHNRKHDTIDLAVIELTTNAFEEMLDTAAGYAPICALANHYPATGIYGVVGFPETLNEFVPEYDPRRGFARLIPSEPVILFATPAEPAAYRTLGFSPELTFVGALHSESLRDSRVPNNEPLKPQGVSGGAMFYFGTATETEAGSADVRLVGIVTHYYEDTRMIVAANGRAVFRLLRALGISPA